MEMEEIVNRKCAICQKDLSAAGQNTPPFYVHQEITFEPIDPLIIPEWDVPYIFPEKICFDFCPECAKKEFAKFYLAIRDILLKKLEKYREKIQNNWELLYKTGTKKPQINPEETEKFWNEVAEKLATEGIEK